MRTVTASVREAPALGQALRYGVSNDLSNTVATPPLVSASQTPRLPWSSQLGGGDTHANPRLLGPGPGRGGSLPSTLPSAPHSSDPNCPRTHGRRHTAGHAAALGSYGGSPCAHRSDSFNQPRWRTDSVPGWRSARREEEFVRHAEPPPVQELTFQRTGEETTDAHHVRHESRKR